MCSMAANLDMTASTCRQTALERQDLSCTYLVHHELDSVIIIIIIIINIIIINIIINYYYYYY